MRKLPAISFSALLCGLLCTLALTSCGGSDGGGAPPHSIPPPPAPSNLSYPTAPAFTEGTAITALSPTVTGQVTSYMVSPALPAGLALNGQSGVISGTPTTATAQATYTVTASNASGATAATLSLVVNARIPPPVASYGASALTYTVGMPAQLLTPTVTGKTTGWSVSPALPAGLMLNASTGALSGTPTQAAAMTTYTVKASNAGGTFSLPLLITVVGAAVVDLGHGSAVTAMAFNGSQLLSFDGGHWILQNFATGAVITSGTQECVTNPCPIYSNEVELAGTTLMVASLTGFNTFTAANNAPLATVTTSASWYALSSDGSYVATGNASGLTVWSATTGQALFSHAGNYANAVVFATPTSLQVALGAAGGNVIQTLTVPAGTSTTSAAFSGAFSGWFIDGSSFLTTQGNTVWVYSASAVQESIVSAAAPLKTVGGKGPWFWTLDTTANGNVSVYAVGSNGPAAYATQIQIDGIIVGSGSTLGLLPADSTSATIVDLSGATPVAASYTLPIPQNSAYAATSASTWAVGTGPGVIVDGSSLPAQARYLTYGQAQSIAGGTGYFAVATSSGSILLFNSSTNALAGTINFPSSSLSMSADGSVLAASANTWGQTGAATSLNIYAIPAATLVNSFPYSVLTFSLAGSGTVIAELDGSTPISVTGCKAQVIAIGGGTPIWCDTSGQFQQLVLSPDGTLLAATSTQNTVPLQPGFGSSSNVYLNGALLTAVPGWAIGWSTNTSLLVNQYTSIGDYTDLNRYTNTGSLISSVTPPQMLQIQPVTVASSFVYSSGQNTIVNTANGNVSWTSGDAFTPICCPPLYGIGAVAGSQVVFASGNFVLAQPAYLH